MKICRTQKISFHYLKKINFLLDYVKLLQNSLEKKNLKVLDIGCGVGNFSLAVADLGCSVVGVDVDASSIEYANKRKENLDCTFHVGNAHSLDFKKLFDIIICSEVLEHLKYPEKLLMFISKHLDKKGLLFLSIPNGFGPSELSCMPRRGIGKFLKLIRFYSLIVDFKRKVFKNSIKKAQGEFGTDTLNFYGGGALHEQFFSYSKIKKLFLKYNLNIINHQNSFIFVGFFPLYHIYSKSILLQKIDCFFADLVHPIFSSGWSFILQKGRGL